jgi:hypothetical protein
VAWAVAWAVAWLSWRSASLVRASGEFLLMVMGMVFGGVNES